MIRHYQLHRAIIAIVIRFTTLSDHIFIFNYLSHQLYVIWNIEYLGNKKNCKNLSLSRTRGGGYSLPSFVWQDIVASNIIQRSLSILIKLHSHFDRNILMDYTCNIECFNQNHCLSVCCFCLSVSLAHTQHTHKHAHTFWVSVSK